MKKRIGLFGVFGIMALAPLAHADYEIAYKVGAGSVTSCLDNPDSTNTTGTVTCSATVGGVSIDAAGGTSNSPGASAGADEFSSVATLVNTSGSTQTITLWYLAQGFSNPVTGGGVTGISYTSNAGATGELGSNTSTLDLVSCADKGTGGVGTSFCLTPEASITNPTLPVPASGNASNGKNILFTPLTAPYSLEQQVTLSLGAGDTINISLSQSLTPVPEPMSIALLGGILVLTTGAIRRKRNQASRS